MDAPKNAPGRSTISTQLAIGLALAIALDTAVQVLWKKASDALPAATALSPASLATALLHQPLFLLVAVLIVAQMINWLKTLDHADVSFAQPITALSYISVALVSRLWFGEPVTVGRLAGMAMILAGVFLVARTEPNTEHAPPKEPGVIEP